MAKKSEDDLEKRTLNFVKGDFAILAEHYPEVGPSVIVRTLVHKHVQTLIPKDIPKGIVKGVKL